MVAAAPSSSGLHSAGDGQHLEPEMEVHGAEAFELRICGTDPDIIPVISPLGIKIISTEMCCQESTTSGSKTRYVVDL